MTTPVSNGQIRQSTRKRLNYKKPDSITQPWNAILFLAQIIVVICHLHVRFLAAQVIQPNAPPNKLIRTRSPPMPLCLKTSRWQSLNFQRQQLLDPRTGGKNIGGFLCFASTISISILVCVYLTNIPSPPWYFFHVDF